MSRPSRSWQTILDHLTSEVVEGDMLDRIDQLTSEEDLVKCLAAASYIKELSDWTHIVLNDAAWRKCAVKAKSLRELGNKAFCSKEYQQSLNLYTESMKYAPVGSKELSLALANRSAALVHLQLHEHSLKDITRAFENGYPLHLHYKLYQRRAECFLVLKKPQEALNARASAQGLVDAAKDMSAYKKALITDAIDNLPITAMERMSAAVDSDINDKFDTFPLPSPTRGFNEEFPSASKAICLKESKEKGRFVVAQHGIEVGDILFVEKPFAFVLLPEHYDSRCHQCCKLLKTPVACCKCSIPLYCNEECRDHSWEQYHKWECNGGLNVAHAVGIAHLGLRLTLNAGGLEEHKAYRNELTDGKDFYSSVYGLVTNLSDMSVEDRIAYALTAVCLMLYLKNHTSYFTPSTVSESLQDCSDDHIFVGAIILRHICQLVCNGHAIVDVESVKSPETNVEDLKQVRLAAAIYPSASMMNHSCDPNIINSFSGVHLIVKASKNIPSGGEVFNCYGPSYRTMPYSERQEALKAQYCFNCTCEKCSTPSEHSFQDRFRALRCPKCNGALIKAGNIDWDFVCLNCKEHPEPSTSKQISDLAEAAHDRHRKACELLERGLVDDALKEFQECYDVQLQSLYAFHEEHRNCLNKIAKCYALSGDLQNSILYLRRTLRAVAQQFGSLSIEMAHELQTLTDVMLADIEERKFGPESLKSDCEVALQHVCQAKKILELFYGPWNSALQSIMAKEQKIKEVIEKLSV